jgi:hypothetical protein
MGLSRAFPVSNESSVSVAVDVVVGRTEDVQPPLPLASDGVQRYVWRSAFGSMLIELRDGAAFVNGQRVTPIADLCEATRPADTPACQAVGGRDRS